MPKWTTEQQLAIDKEGSNIIVSAGAGSGKTAVLSERTIRKLLNGVNIDNLLILTFTNAAAFEMKMRIRDKIKKYPELKDQLDRIDSAYITTFDSYSLSLVKKYHYLLNIDNDVKIIDSSVIKLEKIKILDKIFDNYYEQEDPLFLKLISDFTLKDDKEIKESILKLNDKLDLKYKKHDYLLNYINDTFKDEVINNYIDLFNKYLTKKINKINKYLKNISLSTDGDYYIILEESIKPLLESTTYDEIIKNLEVKIPRLPNNSEEEVKYNKTMISNIITSLKKECIYLSTSEIRNNYYETKDYIKVIIDIILKLDQEIYLFKSKTNCYEFIDISKMAINLVKNNPEIKNELKNYFNEIMIDEYQDTSDLQEEFISEIENDNVYMVGDIKQSIYRFRNANPYIFKNKYDSYSKNINGYKIDLNKNFRSREEVLNNINYLFNYFMTDNIGGAEYKDSHQMIFGNTMYTDTKKEEQNYNIDIYNYKLPEKTKFKNNEIEIFIIANDIKNKIENKYQVIDKETSKLRDIKYSDFAILIDKSKSFTLYKKIFEYLNIPIMICKDTSITEEDDLIIINNILKLINLVKNKDFNKEFKRNFISISRSYLFNYPDSYIFKTLLNNSYQETSLYKKINDIASNYDNLNSKELLYRIIDDFDFYKKQLSIGDVKKQMARVSYLLDMMDSMSNLHYSLEEVIDRFNILVDNNEKIECSIDEEYNDAVKIMTIHKSKGLEFPICYFTEFFNSFNIKEIKDKFILDNKYGFIIPSVTTTEKDNFVKNLMKDDYIKEEISEKIRLLYVAVTRAKEKMIIISNIEEDETKELDDDIKEEYRSFKDMIKSIWDNLNSYKKEIDLDSINLTKDYNKIKESNYKDNIKKTKDIIKYDEIEIDNEVINETSFSKKINDLITKENYESINLGKRFHYIFETIDFIKPNYSNLNEFEKNKIKSFLNLDILKNINDYKIYKEYEFMTESDNEIKHGIIDLMIETDNKIMIIDYKLKHIVDDNYKKQLNGYKLYMNNKTNKDIEIYLYSILDESLEKII